MPCWYELGTSDLTAASAFYAEVMGWTITDSGMPGMNYLLATATDGGTVSGMMEVQGGASAPPPSWLIYFTAADCDERVAAISAVGGTVITAPADIPGTGRFAVVADPQGAAFGLLQPLPMEAPLEHPAFDQQASGHGNWHELMSSDPEAGLAFYAGQFGWTKGDTMDMGEMGTYQIFGGGGLDLGGMMGLGNSPVSACPLLRLGRRGPVRRAHHCRWRHGAPRPRRSARWRLDRPGHRPPRWLVRRRRTALTDAGSGAQL